MRDITVQLESVPAGSLLKSLGTCKGAERRHESADEADVPVATATASDTWTIIKVGEEIIKFYLF